jgi:hypothetical protein
VLRDLIPDIDGVSFLVRDGSGVCLGYIAASALLRNSFRIMKHTVDEHSGQKILICGQKLKSFLVGESYVSS